MGIVAKRSGGDFELAPAGPHAARCIQLVDLGLQKSQYGIKEQVILGFELTHTLMAEGDNEGKPFMISNFYTKSLAEKANLLRDLQAWRGREFTEEELDGFDLRDVVGAPCLVTVGHVKKDDKIRAKMLSITSLPKGMTLDDAVNPIRIYDLDDPAEDVYEALPEWIQKKIGERVLGGHAAGAAAASSDEGPPPIADDDIPF